MKQYLGFYHSGQKITRLIIAANSVTDARKVARVSLMKPKKLHLLVERNLSVTEIKP